MTSMKKENNMDRALDSVGNAYRLSFLGDISGWKGYRTFGVPGENDKSSGVLRRKGTAGLWVIHILSTEVCLSR